MKESPEKAGLTLRSFCDGRRGHFKAGLARSSKGFSRGIRQHVLRLMPLLLLLSFLPGLRTGWAQSERGRTRNPHGPLKVACQNCHTETGWKPLRPVPEFNHNETRFPLRGMHVSVDCRQCHTKLVFTDVGKNCADCHADIHRRQFGGNCEECHTVRGWQVSNRSVKGHQNRFPLLGAHAAVDCESCHKNAAAGQFVGLSTACSSCHMRDFVSTKVLDHQAAKLPTQCDQCHRMDSWGGATFDHARFGGFALTGAHAQLDCVQCHVGNRFAGTPADCFGCHSKDFTGANNPNHVAAGFTHDCQTCHNTSTWANAKFNHNTMTKFPLTGAHVALNCDQCHIAGRFAGTPQDCYSCHVKDFESTKDPDHRAGHFPTDCSGCHTTANWLNAKFDHNLSKFPLTGAHASLVCKDCHAAGVPFAAVSTACQSCHLKDFNSAANPNHVAAGFPQDCSICHTTVQWKGAKYDHNTMTKFPLTGAHIPLNCADCHKNNVFAGLATSCVSCHLADFNNSKNPNHVAAGFPQDCTICHTTAQWKGGKFDHNTTKFPLTGSHVPLACGDCHKNNVFAGLATSCVSCHLTDFNNSKSPNHVAAGFPQDCTICHTTVQWKGAKFDHNTTKFPLTGAHVPLGCADCHKNNVFAGLSTACVSCHLTDFNNSKNPNHIAAGFPQSCEICHTTAQWQGAKFDHSKTRFPLTGAHATVGCQSCHGNNQFATLSTACVSCHLNDFNGAKSPNHAAAGFPQDCTICHNTTQWMGAKFDHTAMTKFPLTGAHVNVACSTCHKNNVFAGLATACVSCHLADFNGANSPPHAAAGFPQDCTICHNTTQWMGAKFDHTAMTKFPLTGAHVSVACSVCHKNNVFAGLSTACISCHQADFNGTNNPNHAAAGFPQDCSVCHTTVSWANATFNHNTATKFPLAGPHTSVACSACHKNNVFAGLSTACVSCHLTDFNGANSPPHAAAGFPQDCSLCHAVVAAWAGATFNHNTSTRFPLTGAHVNVACATCHKNNVYVGLSTACISCHLTDFNGTTNPNHVAAGFPQDCSLCHTTVAGWGGATFNHNTATKFPLTGAHVNVACATCHKNNVFVGLATTCVSCHLADYNGTTNPNHAAAGFPQDCSLCHNTTSYANATFNHNTTTTFPLTGAHVNVACSACHLNNVFKGLATSCVSCHLAKYNATTNPAHAAAGFPQDCSLCHGVVAGWAGAVFNHTTQTTFPLTGAHVNVACASCHKNNVFAGLSTACVTCHLADYSGTTNPSHSAAGFPQDCSICHTTVAGWGGATFDHSKTPFPLTGAHVGVACLSCHVGNKFAGTPMDCYSCHSAEYKNTTNPNHTAAGFPTTCQTCHQVVAGWAGATFNHTWFPTNHGNAKGVCSTCHTNPNDYSVFVCTNCHLKTTTDNNHRGVNNYVYNSANCYACHPRGNGG